MIYRVYINFKKGILDPEAEAIKRTIDSMGYKTVKNISKMMQLLSITKRKIRFQEKVY